MKNQGLSQLCSGTAERKSLSMYERRIGSIVWKNAKRKRQSAPTTYERMKTVMSIWLRIPSEIENKNDTTTLFWVLRTNICRKFLVNSSVHACPSWESWDIFGCPFSAKLALVFSEFRFQSVAPKKRKREKKWNLKHKNAWAWYFAFSLCFEFIDANDPDSSSNFLKYNNSSIVFQS